MLTVVGTAVTISRGDVGSGELVTTLTVCCARSARASSTCLIEHCPARNCSSDEWDASEDMLTRVIPGHRC